MPAPEQLFGILLCSVGGLVAVPPLLLLGQGIAALGYRAPHLDGEPTARLTVLVPAHNEAQLISRCIASLRSQDYPPELYRVVVIADNCTDDTARLAEAAGASVLIRQDPTARGKGRALRWAMDQLLPSTDRPDTFVVVDADSIADRGLLVALSACHRSGAEAVQGDYRVIEEDSSPRVQLRALAFVLFHRVRFAGRAVLGLPCSLVGNGMLLGADLIEGHPWSAFTSTEDLEYSVQLRLRGVRPVFAAKAAVWGPVADSQAAAQVQRERWEGGRMHVARTFLPRVMRQFLFARRWDLADVILDLAMPPLGLLAVASLAGSALTGLIVLVGGAPVWAIGPWVAALAAIVGYVLLGSRAAGSPRLFYRAVAFAPGFLGEKVRGIPGVLRTRPAETWIRTERPGEGRLG